MLACSADAITMGEDVVQAEAPPLPSTSRCRQSRTIDGDVLVEKQEQLAELEGCTAIDGTLTVLPFEGADLRPLYALATVSGAVDIGGTYVTDIYWREPWLPSLAGLESLESAGEFLVSGLLADNVDALSGLAHLDLAREALARWGSGAGRSAGPAPVAGHSQLANLSLLGAREYRAVGPAQGHGQHLVLGDAAHEPDTPPGRVCG
jgi:hypothetical protein